VTHKEADPPDANLIDEKRDCNNSYQYFSCIFSWCGYLWWSSRGSKQRTLSLKLIEPLRERFKDEGCKLGVELGIDIELVKRHPFFGPGLAVLYWGSWEVMLQYEGAGQKDDRCRAHNICRGVNVIRSGEARCLGSFAMEKFLK
jgi:hypothetical protein